MTDLTADLRALAADVEWPETPDLAASVVARLALPTGSDPLSPSTAGGSDPLSRTRSRGLTPRARRRLVVVVALIVLALPAAAFAIPASRHAILDAFGLRHVRVERRTTLPHAARDPRLGRRIALPRDALVPRALGAPDAVYRNGDIITLVYDRRHLLLAQAAGRLPGAPVLEKMVHIDDRARRTTVGGSPAVFLGEPHAYAWTDATGPPVRSGPVLIWERGDTVLRLEGEPDVERARRVASSVR